MTAILCLGIGFLAGRYYDLVRDFLRDLWDRVRP